MTELLTAAQMRAIEQAAIDSCEVTGLELMERAGRGVVKATLNEWPDLEPPQRFRWPGFLGRIVRRISRGAGKVPRAGVLCGPGNNGGDGFVVARLLRQRGWDIEVFLYGDILKLPPDAAINAQRFMKDGGMISPIVPHKGRDMRFADPPTDIWIDAFFGTGLTRPLPDEVHAAFLNIYYERNWQDSKLVAVDILSGVHTDTGERLTPFPLVPDLTVTFYRAKLGHMTGEGASCTGKLVIDDIGLSQISDLEE